MTKKSKKVGDNRENRVAKELEADDYIYEKARPDLRWIAKGRCISMHHDFFGLFDFIALKKIVTDYGTIMRIRMIQVTDTAHGAERRTKIERCARFFHYPITLEVWAERPDGQWSKLWFKDGAWEPVTW